MSIFSINNEVKVFSLGMTLCQCFFFILVVSVTVHVVSSVSFSGVIRSIGNACVVF